MNIEDIWIDHGSHSPDAQKGCVMEWVGVKWLMTHGMTMTEAWELLTDSPRCTDRMIYSAAQRVNDRLSDAERQRLVPLIDRLMRCHTPTDLAKAQRVRVRVSCWAARSVLDLITDDETRAKALRPIETAEAWLRGEATKDECRGAADAAYAAADAAAAYAAYAAYAAARDRAERDLVAWLDKLIDQWEKACAEEGTLSDPVPVPA